MTDTLYIPRGAKSAQQASGDYYSTPIWGMKTGGKIVCRFVTNPFTTSELVDWHATRDIWTSALLVGQSEYPLNLIPSVFKTLDYRIVPSAGGDPMVVLDPSADPLIKYTKPGKYDNGTHAESGRAFYVNIVFESGHFGPDTNAKTPEPGEIVLLRLSGAKGDELMQKMDDKKYEEGDAFDPTHGLWELSITGSGTQTTLVARWNRKADPVDLPEPYNVSATLDGIRGHVEGIAAMALGASPVSLDTNAVMDQFEADVAAMPSTDVDLDIMGAQRLREIADGMGIKYSPRATAADLRALIRNASTEDLPF